MTERNEVRSESGPNRQSGRMAAASSVVHRGQGPYGLTWASRDDDGRVRQQAMRRGMRGNTRAPLIPSPASAKFDVYYPVPDALVISALRAGRALSYTCVQSVDRVNPAECPYEGVLDG